MGRFSLENVDKDLDDSNSLVPSSSVDNHHRRNRYDYNENPFPYDDSGTGSPLWIVNDEEIRNDMNNDKHLKRHWVRHMFFIGVIVLLQKYLPPPPPPNDTWHEYISTSTESIMSTAMNMLALTFYIAHGCVVNLKSDVTLHIQTWKSKYQQDGLHHLLFFRINNDSTSRASTSSIWNVDYTPSCSVQSNMEYHSIQQYLSKRIVGQNPSIHIIAEAISSSWESSNRPLSLLLTGPIGVGKYKTVKLLSRMMMFKDNGDGSTLDDRTTDASNCWNSRAVPPCQHAILEMNGFDYALDYYNDNEHGTQMTGQKNMVDMILHHIHQRQGKGAVILIKHVEQLSDSHRSDLIRIMQSPTVVTFQKQNRNTMIKTYQQFLGITEVSNEVEISLQNCVFLLTTDVGTKTIFHAIRDGSHQIDSIQNRIRQDLKHDLGQYFHMVDYVIPYGPLQFSHMKSTLDMEIKDMNCVFQQKMGHGIQITDQALHFLAGPRMIEYIEVPYTDASSTKQDSSFVFAADGGHALPIKAIEGVVYETIQNIPFRSQHDFVRIDYRSDNDILILERCNFDNSSDKNDPFCFDQREFSVHDLLAQQG